MMSSRSTCRAAAARTHIQVLLLAGCNLLAPACGFGRYHDSATLDTITANDGISGHGQWWPWACANGSNPSTDNAVTPYTAVGNCAGAGGTFDLGISGCEMTGNWVAVGLSEVVTTIASSIPEAGGWQVTGNNAGGMALMCNADSADNGIITLSCYSADNATTPACTATLTPVNG